MKIPESIRIGGVEYAVGYEENLRMDNRLCKGTIDYLEHRITLSANDATEHQSRCQTLLHEILHGIRDYFGMEIENEEDVVEMFAKGLYQVLEDNGGRLFELKEEPVKLVTEMPGGSQAETTKEERTEREDEICGNRDM